mgnify:CR=1 FL=1
MSSVLSSRQIEAMIDAGAIRLAAPPAHGQVQPASLDLRLGPKAWRVRASFLPGKAQDLRAWFLSMQYWLGGSDGNIEEMIRYLVSRYSANRDWKAVSAKPPVDYPDVGLYHPDLPARITTNPADLPRPVGAVSTVGLLMLRSYILASDTAHYDAVIRAFEARGIAVLPAFAGGLDGRDSKKKIAAVCRRRKRNR